MIFIAGNQKENSKYDMLTAGNQAEHSKHDILIVGNHRTNGNSKCDISIAGKVGNGCWQSKRKE